MKEATIGGKIRAARKNAGMTQADVARATGLSRTYLGDIENNRYNPSLATMRKIARAVRVPVDALLGDRDALIPAVTQGDPASEILDAPDLRRAVRRYFSGMSPEEAEAKKADAARLLRAIFAR